MRTKMSNLRISCPVVLVITGMVRVQSWSRFPNQAREPSFVLCSNWLVIVAQQSFIQVKFTGGVFRLTFSTEVCVSAGYLFDPVCVISACCCMQTQHSWPLEWLACYCRVWHREGAYFKSVLVRWHHHPRYFSLPFEALPLNLWQFVSFQHNAVFFCC